MMPDNGRSALVAALLNGVPRQPNWSAQGGGQIPLGSIMQMMGRQQPVLPGAMPPGANLVGPNPQAPDYAPYTPVAMSPLGR